MEDFDSFTNDEIAIVKAYLITEAEDNHEFFEDLVIGYVENMSNDEIYKILKTIKENK